MISISLSVVLIVVVILFYEELLSITFDEESAKASGIKTDRINKVLVLLIALTVVLAMKVVGIMLISALLILPPVTALQIAKSFKTTIIVSALSGILSVIFGIFASFVLNLPAGATIVVINFIFFLAAFTLAHTKIVKP